jgi:uncharacterized protein (TIGR03086 family)
MMDSVTALERSYQHLQKTVANVGVDQLTTASQCERWDLRALLNHTFGAGWMFTLVNQGQAAGEDAGDVVGNDPARACAEIASANVAAWQTPEALDGDRAYPFGTFPAPVALLINVGEIAVHGWDLAKSTGQDATIAPDVAAMLIDFYGSLPLEEFRAHGAFGPEIPVNESAPIADRMLGLIGFRA